MALLPLFQLKDATIMQWQTRWKALLDPGLSTKPRPVNIVTSAIPGGNFDFLPGTSGFASNLSVTITTSGNPVVVQLVSGYMLYQGTSGTLELSGTVLVEFYRDGVAINQYQFQIAGLESTEAPMVIPSFALPPNLGTIDTDNNPPEGTHTYTMFIDNTIASNNGEMIGNQLYLTAYELGT